MIRHYGEPPSGPISGSLYDLSGVLNGLELEQGSVGAGSLALPFFLASWLVDGLGS
jgi:hypothetical protein